MSILNPTIIGYFIFNRLSNEKYGVSIDMFEYNFTRNETA